MSRPELNETLTALVGAVPLDASSSRVELDLDVPMEIELSRDSDGLVIHAAPGHTRFVSGFLPVVHHTTLRIVATADQPDEAISPPGWSS